MGKNGAAFLGVILAIVILAAIALNGFPIADFFGMRSDRLNVPSVEDGIKLGLDLVGGSVITFQAVGSSASLTDANMDIAVGMLRRRLDALGYTEATVSVARGYRLRVEIPNVDDPERAIEMLGSTAMLTFEVSDAVVERYSLESNIILTGADVESAQVVVAPLNDFNPTRIPHVVLTFKPEARALFTEATRMAASMADTGDNFIAIALDGIVQTDPRVGAEYATTGIDSASVQVTMGDRPGVTVAQQAREFADLINIGQLPFELRNVAQSTVGPTLGARALETSIWAGLIGLALIIVFMGVFYRVPGLIANVALVLYTVMLLVAMSILGVNLSLAGIAGIILSVGFAVDANIVIFERLKEELRSGKTIRSAVDASFKRALPAILDSNITSIIVAGVLRWQGTGPIRGFADTLLIGIVLSMFSAIVVTRFLLKQLIGMNVKSLKAFGL
jgi:preprotein translocase subunit SecD